MSKKVWIAVVLGTLAWLTACGQANDVELPQFFATEDWQIVERTGFATSQIDGLVSFSNVGNYSVFNLTSLPCGRAGSSAIEWNESGFKLIEPEDPNIGFGTNDAGCDPPDDLHLRFLTFGLNGDQIDVEIAEDGTSATMTKGNSSLTLIPKS